jgi:hypothetical protein
LSSIFDKESKATTINKCCRHSCLTANNKREYDQPEVRPLTKQRQNNNEQKRTDAFDPGNEILDGGEGKKNMHKHFFKTNTTRQARVRTKPTHANKRPHDTSLASQHRLYKQRGSQYKETTEVGIERKTKLEDANSKDYNATRHTGRHTKAKCN